MRQFLVRLAGLGASARSEAVRRFNDLARTPAFLAAELRLAETIERAGRTDARDALAGPLLQLVRKSEAPSGELPVENESDVDVLAQLDPIAEPALAALLALLVADLLPQSTTDQLYAPFAELIPRPAAPSSS